MEIEVCDLKVQFKCESGSVMRACAKRFKDGHNGLIQEVWAQEMSPRHIEEVREESPSCVNLISYQWAD